MEILPYVNLFFPLFIEYKNLKYLFLVSHLNNLQQQQQQTPHATQNSSQTVTTVRTSSSIDTTTMTTQQVTGITQLPAATSLLNGQNQILNISFSYSSF